MDKRSVELIVGALNQNQVRYLIVGGMAVVAHGYVRFTAVVDLVLSLENENVARAISALRQLGYTPRAPVAIEEFADPDKRRQWKREKGLTVFSLFSAQHPATEIDLFAEEPLDFSAAYGRAALMEAAPGVAATFCSLDDLIAMKTKAGRRVDEDDVLQLRQIKK